MTSAGAAIEVRGLTKRVGKACLLEPLDLSIPTGSVVALVGPNGAGKTTLLKLLLNIVRPTSGAATVLGVPTVQLRGVAFNGIGYVSENQELPEWMSVRQLMDHLRPLYPGWHDEALLQEMQLPCDRKIRDLSRGMRMKTVVASVLAFGPRLLFMDEPFTGLDTAVRAELIQALLDRAHDGETTIVISSHDLEEVETFATHVAFLRSGRLLFAEPLDALLVRCREVSVTFAEETAEREMLRLPVDCVAAEASGAMLRFVDLQADVANHEDAIRSLMPTAMQVQSERMNLRAIFLALNKSGQR
jgi:ABC-2 type transport system ATP-binding protein